MATFVEVKDVEECWHSINIKNIARVSWGENPDEYPRDMIYLTDNSEIALPHLSDSSWCLAEAVGINHLGDFLGVSDDSGNTEEDEEDSEDDE